MFWLVDKIVDHIDLLLAAADITSGLRKILMSACLLIILTPVTACTFVHRESQDAIGVTTDAWVFRWGGDLPPPPAAPVYDRTTSRPPAQESIALPSDPVPASPNDPLPFPK